MASRSSGLPILDIVHNNAGKREVFVLSGLASRRSRARTSSIASSTVASSPAAMSITSRGFQSGTISYISSPIGRAPLPEESPPPSPPPQARRLGPLSPRKSVRSPRATPSVRTPTRSLLPQSPTAPPSPSSPSYKRRKRASDLSALLGPLAGKQAREIHLEDEGDEAEDEEPDWGFTGPLQAIPSRSSAGESIRMEVSRQVRRQGLEAYRSGLMTGMHLQPSDRKDASSSPSSSAALASGRFGLTRQTSGSSTSSVAAGQERGYHYVRQSSLDGDKSPRSLKRAVSGVSGRSGITIVQRKATTRSSSSPHTPQRPPRPPSLVSDLILNMWDGPLDVASQQQLVDELRHARSPPSAYRKLTTNKATTLQTQAYGSVDRLSEPPLPSPTASQILRRRNSELFADPYRPSASPLLGAAMGRLSAASSIRSQRSARRTSGDSKPPGTGYNSDRPISQNSTGSPRRTRTSSRMDGSTVLDTPSLMSHRESTSSVTSRIPPMTPPSMAIPPTPDEAARHEKAAQANSFKPTSGHQRTDTKEIILGFPLPPSRASAAEEATSPAGTSATRGDACHGAFTPTRKLAVSRPPSPDLKVLTRTTPRPRRRSAENEVESDIGA